jgi:hypothetical protein
MILRILPLILSFLLLGAHFFRGGNIILTAVCILLPLLLLFKKRWILLLLRGLIYCGALVWVHTAVVLVQQRILLGIPWMRMILILLGVTVLTLYAGFLLSSDTIKQRYP